MFTGLVEKVGSLKGLTPCADGTVLRIEHDPWDVPLVIGESVAVQGVCLTVTALNALGFSAHVLDETFSRTTMAVLPVGTRLNLERALKVGDRLGGHLVSGHVDGIGHVRGISRQGNDRIVNVGCPQELTQCMIHKGSIAIDGVSLTIAELGATHFAVCIIPHTWEETSLRERTIGSGVNLETDMLGKYVQKAIRTSGSSGVTMETLANAGLT